MSNDQIFKVRATDKPGEFVPLAGSSVPAGFPSPADDHLDRALDFNELLIENAAATFAVKIAGESMTGAGIFPKDIAVVRRDLTPANGSIVITLLNNQFSLKRLRMRDGQIMLQAENPAYPDVTITEGDALEIWGVVTAIVRNNL